jgi:DNA helicase IV
MGPREHMIVPACARARAAVPCRLTEDPLLKPVLREEDAFDNAEERRVFYVAGTTPMKTVRLIHRVG